MPKLPVRRRRRRDPRSMPTSLSAAVWLVRTRAALGTTVVLSVLAVGAVHTRTLLLVVAMAGVAALCAHKVDTRTRPGLATWLCLALAGWSALQALPLPAALVALVSPGSADVWARSVEPLGLATPKWMSLSLDPGASLREACRFSGYAATIYAASVIARQDRRPDFGAQLVFGSGVVVALATALHGLAGLDRVWGLYEPGFRVQSWHMGPLLNPNNLSGYLNLAFFCGLGLLLQATTRRRTANWGLLLLGLMTLVGVSVLSASRAGVALLPVGILAIGVVSWLQGKREGVKVSIALGGLALAAGAGLAALGGTASAWAELFNGGLEKLSLTGWMQEMVHDHPWFGIGRGAFESVSPAYQPTVAHVHFTHAEMFPLHWAIEWGVVVAVLALLAFGFVLRPNGLTGLDRPTGLGVYVGVVILLLQNLFDLGLEIPGVVMALAVCVGSLTPAPSRRTMPSRAPKLLFGGSFLLAFGLAATVGRSDLEKDRQHMGERARHVAMSGASIEAFKSDLAAAIGRHPAEPYFPLLGALVANERGHEPPMPWIQHALERGEANGRIHLLLAYVLARHGATNQALMELRFAVERDITIREPAAALAVKLAEDPEVLMRAVPDGVHGVKMLDALSHQLEGRGLALDREIVARDPGHVDARVRLANATLEAMAAEEESCRDLVACRGEVEAHAKQLEEAAPRSSAAARVRARLLVLDGRSDEAAAMLAKRCQEVSDRRRCLLVAVEVASKTSEHELLAEVCERLMSESCSDRRRCASTAERLGHLYRERGVWPVSLLYYQRALAEDETVDRLLNYARAAKRAGAMTKARVALQRALPRYPERKSDIQKQIQELH